jgi:cell pole-organizing protein PopZ
MEEILASIRRIIADDDAVKPPPAVAKSAPAPPVPTPAPAAKNNQDDIDVMLAGFDVAEVSEEPAVAADVLELTESMQAKPPAFNTIEGPPDVVFSEPVPEPERPPPEAPYVPIPDRTLLSPRTTAAVDMAFNSLAHTVLVQNSRTLEDLVREMLKPMLKSWLDDNLPGMVERLVRAEIERVSRGRG